jgi:hypothetical protein
MAKVRITIELEVPDSTDSSPGADVDNRPVSTSGRVQFVDYDPRDLPIVYYRRR